MLPPLTTDLELPQAADEGSVQYGLMLVALGACGGGIGRHTGTLVGEYGIQNVIGRGATGEVVPSSTH